MKARNVRERLGLRVEGCAKDEEGRALSTAARVSDGDHLGSPTETHRERLFADRRRIARLAADAPHRGLSDGTRLAVGVHEPRNGSPSASEKESSLRHFGAAIAHRQALAFDLARRAQLATVMLVVSRYAARQQDPLVRQAGVCAALDLGTRLTDSRPSAQMYHLVTELGRAVAEDRFALVQDAERGTVLMAESAAG